MQILSILLNYAVLLFLQSAVAISWVSFVMSLPLLSKEKRRLIEKEGLRKEELKVSILKTKNLRKYRYVILLMRVKVIALILSILFLIITLLWVRSTNNNHGDVESMFKVLGF